MRKFALFVAVATLALSAAMPAFAVGADGVGREFGAHHASHAQEMVGFTGGMNPGNHLGFAGWMAE